MNRAKLCAPIGALALLASTAHAAPFGADIVGKHGMTHADALLLNDVNNLMHNAVPVLVERTTHDPKSIACGQMVRTDTVVTHMDSPHQWSEIWTYRVCQVQIAIPLNFLPDPNGGTNFAIKADAVKVTPIPGH
jgi:hypothetical protein